MKSQLQIIIEKLNKDGEVSRNWCLERYITRLGSRIYDLKKDGWEFEILRKGGDYIYVLVHKGEPNQLKMAINNDRIGKVNA